MTTARTIIAIQQAVFDPAAELARLTKDLAGIGAIVSFVGVCRDEGGRLSALELEHYPGMAEAEFGRIAATAAERWPLVGITIIHRTGRIAVGEPIVLVVTVAGHRRDAFEAANYVMDYLKTAAPIWKKEHAADGTAAGWVEAKASDDAAFHRWHKKP